MAEALINVLLEQLVTVAFDHTKEAVKLILNAETEVKKFRSNLKAIQAVLEDAEKQQVENASVRNWLDELNDVSYKMVDVLDEWNTEILKQEAMRVPSEKKETFKKVCFSISSTCFCFGPVNKATHLYRVATEIKELNEKLTMIAAQKEQFGFHQSSTRRVDEQLIKSLETSSFVDISRIFGREEAQADLLNKLLSESSEEEKEIPIIPLVGMGGMGKTTLAQLAYNNENVKTYFDKRVWVCVSDPFDSVKIAKAIISGTGNSAPDSTELQVVLQCMSRCLEGMKFLIVLDDVWTENQREWESLKLPIMMRTCVIGSKIVVTTRKERVAEIMGATIHMIHLKKLSDENCLALFNSIAYLGREMDEANGFGSIGEKIAKKCDGLPLAVKTLGALLHYKKKKNEWEEILNSNIWALKEVEQQVFQPLLLSYYELAPAVRRCLLYCATFPKDYQFSEDNLIKLWMSQDYLSGKDYKGKEKLGRNVFGTLVMRSFFQDVVEEVGVDEYKNITVCCKMHDIVHDFVQFLNRNECFAAEVKEADKEILRISEEVRHLTLMFVPYESSFLDLISPANCKKLRTLATFDSKISSVDLIAISKMKCLRTLNLSNNAIEEFPEEMGALIHLRYLDLSRNWRLEKLPDSVGNLYNLQTLRLDGCDELSALPESMGNLTKLRHLHNKYCRNLAYLPRGIARLTSLQTLDFCPVMDGECLKLEDLGSLDQLEGSLKIVIKTFKGKLNDATSEAHKARLWSKKLYFLTIEIALLTEEQTQRTADILLEALRPHQDLLHLNIWGDTLWPCSAVPSWMIPLQNLRSLELWRFRGFECLPRLGTLPFLEEFSVSGMDKVKRVGHEFLGMPISQTTSSSSSSVFFPKLKKLYLTELCEWEHWEEVEGDGVTIMPCLDHLQIYHCPKLVNLPLFLQNTALSKVIISGCRQSIIIPIMPANCDVEIEDEIEDSEDERVETETHIVSQIDEEITVIT